MCLHRDKQKLLPIIENNTSIGKQTTPGKVNKLHRMLRASNILNVKVECIRPRMQGVNALNFIRFKSNSASSLNNNKTSRSLSLVQEHIVNDNPTNSEVINSVLTPQGVTISQKELDELLKLPSVNFDLPITEEMYPSLLALIRKPQSKRSKTGVYIFTHKQTGNKYVGSTNDLARRLNQYFDKAHMLSKKKRLWINSTLDL